MGLEKLPLIVTETEFDKNGFAVTDSGLLVPAYVASQLAFSKICKIGLQDFYKRLREEAHTLPLCPLTACAEYLDWPALESAKTPEEAYAFWDKFNMIIGPVNYGELMPRSKFMIAIFDGGHASDDGVSAEVGHYATEYKGERPVFGIRSDFRLAENPAAPINPAVRYFMDTGPYGGEFFSGPDAYERCIEHTRDFALHKIESV